MGGRGAGALDPRLSMIARLVGSCESCADIGCDHGRLGAFLLQSGQCRRVLLTDISAPSLEKARALMHGLGLTDRARFSVGNGALALDETPQVAVIAGMGGTTIARILREGRERLDGARLVLQPNVASGELLTKELQRWVKDRTAPYKFPRLIDYVEALPRTTNGKIRRAVLREWK